MADSQFQARRQFVRSVVADDDALPAVSVPIEERFRSPATELRYPALGESNARLGSGAKTTKED